MKWCQVKNPFPSLKLSFISACFSPCSLIFGRQFPTLPHFLCFLCFPLLLLLALPLTQSIQPIASYLLRLFRMGFFFFSLFALVIFLIIKSPQNEPNKLLYNNVLCYIISLHSYCVLLIVLFNYTDCILQRDPPVAHRASWHSSSFCWLTPHLFSTWLNTTCCAP